MAILAKDPILNLETIDAIIDKYNEPSWLANMRKQAFKKFEETPWPSNKNEVWRFSQVDRFNLSGLRPSKAQTRDVSNRIKMRIIDSDAEGTIVFKANENIYQSANILERGAIFCDLRSAVITHENLVKKYLYSIVNTDNKYTSLNAAFWENGSFVYVPKGVELNLPLGAFITADSGGLLNTRSLVVLEDNAKATFIDEYSSDNFEKRLFSSAVNELILADGAYLRYVNLQNWGRNVAHINKMKAKLGRSSRLENLTVNLGADAARSEIESVLGGAGSESEMLGLYFADKGQHFNHYTLQHHKKDHSFSDLLFKGALRDGSSTVYSGNIVVNPKAQKTDAYQTNRNFLLDDSSHAVSIPQLEIAADDVKCSHGSTVSPVPEDQRFYLMSRGLKPEVAEHVLVTSFLHEVSSRVSLPKVAEYVERIVQAKLGVPGVKEKL